jgi:hypothetical protein
VEEKGGSGLILPTERLPDKQQLQAMQEKRIVSMGRGGI